MFTVLALGGCGGGGGSPTPVSQPPDPPEPDPEPVITVPPSSAEERFSGGDASTTVNGNDEAFGQAPRAIQQAFALDANFKLGNAIFRNDHSGEGPLLNARTCQGCHTKDGRGRTPPDTTTPMDTMSIRLGLGVDENDTTIPDSTYGVLLQVFGLASFSGGDISVGLSVFGEGGGDAIGEGFGLVEYEEVPGSFDDGEPYSLRRPIYKVRELSYGDFDTGIQFSPRVAPQVFGLGLLGAVSDETILAYADPDDGDGDGISGRAAVIVDNTTGETRVGRFGVKATVASILQQTSGAYRADMGVTSSFAPEEPCTAAQVSCQQIAAMEPNMHPGGVDLADIELALVEFYVRTLAVPQRRGFDEETETWDDDVLSGRTIFFEAGCEQCHRQRMTTSSAVGSVLGEVDLNVLVPDAPPIDVLSNQTIYPYTDLLLHDMGGQCDTIVPETAEGEPCGAGNNCIWVQRCEGLADGRPEGQASGSEWRTAPLWGLGLVETVNPNATYLHDGRARTIAEAILWHGGEATDSRDAFLALDVEARDDLLTFLESL
ncbi:MAG: di-heme oxidoredictase family protein [Pseudomonadota bacterium]